MGSNDLLLLGNSKRQRPAVIMMPSLLPFDPNSPNGDIVHTTLADVPEQILPAKPDIDWVNGDAWGMTLDASMMPPLVVGCNTTPRQMLMSYLLPRYDRTWQDIMLAGHCQRNRSHFHLDEYTMDDCRLSVPQKIALIQYVQSWGFFTTYWGNIGPGNATLAQAQTYLSPLLRAVVSQTDCSKSIFVITEEMNSRTTPGGGGQGCDDIIRWVCSIANPAGLRVALHFTSNYGSWYAAPITNSIDWWVQFRGMLWGLFYQANAYNDAGTISAQMWDWRRYLDDAAGNFRLCAFELKGTPQLYGQCSEVCGARTAWEMICATRVPPNPNAPPVAGSGNGPWRPDGRPIILNSW